MYLSVSCTFLGVVQRSCLFPYAGIRICRRSVVGIATRLRAGRSKVQIQVGARCPDRLLDPSSLLFNGYRVFFPRGQSGRGMHLTTHTYLVPKLGISGAIFLILLHIFMAWIRETLPLHGNSGQYRCYVIAARAEFWCNTKLFNISVSTVSRLWRVVSILTNRVCCDITRVVRSSLQLLYEIWRSDSVVAWDSSLLGC